ncbi:hypothetical protein [Dyadobacter fermentans]|uniref:DUF2281 domain-containing protein n=1 Tax=Dyadobacter fermentans (strain ATCC 700827 / DSM 18053 / CIP 107007 / KCTC 52180 / NS114) TaxID=471854 RepID=C6W2R0_DYAFD|nr:hypothetical protein [Dyadobacter fermentans]ACT95623.1 hypothetical protein Dfer_4421 [Dyadobacter fermentans DSM 18053]
MNDLIQTYNQLSDVQQKQLVAFANLLLLKQKAKKPTGNLADWKEKIANVSTWSEEDIEALEQNAKHLNAWRVQGW